MGINRILDAKYFLVGSRCDYSNPNEGDYVKEAENVTSLYYYLFCNGNWIKLSLNYIQLSHTLYDIN